MLTRWEYEKLWEMELRHGRAHDFGDLKRAIERRVDRVIEQRERRGNKGGGTIPLAVVDPLRREEALAEVAGHAVKQLDLEDEYTEDRWFSYLRLLDDFTDDWEDESGGDAPWEEPRLSAARALASTVPFEDYDPAAGEEFF